MTDAQLLLLYIPVITIASSVAYNSIMFSKESKYIKATYKRKERERIIALLDKLRDSEYAEVMTHDDIVALIKGE
jgi:hypothetical protein